MGNTEIKMRLMVKAREERSRTGFYAGFVHEFVQPLVERTVVAFFGLLCRHGDIAHPGSLENLDISVGDSVWNEKGKAHSSHEDLVTLINAEVGITKKRLASILSA